MNKLNKQGFTLVELIIVIAVIAILATVLIPTFNGVIKKARASAALQEARSAYEETLAMDLADGVLDGEEVNTALTSSKITVLTANDDGTDYATFTFKAANDYTVTYSDGTWGTPQPPSEE